MPFAKVVAALEEFSDPNRSSEDENQKLRYRCKSGRSMRAGAADRGRIVGAELLHELERPPHHAAEPGLAHEHVVRFLGEHEAAGARERVEPRFREALELELAVTVGEIGEAEERQPVGDRLVERAEDARLVGVARVAREQLLGLLAAVAAEVARGGGTPSPTGACLPRR